MFFGQILLNFIQFFRLLFNFIEFSRIIEVVGYQQTRRQISQLDFTRTTGIIHNINTSQFNDLVFDLIGFYFQFQFVFFRVFINKYHCSIFLINFNTLQYKIYSLTRLLFDTSIPPGDELKRVLEEEGVIEVSQVH